MSKRSIAVVVGALVVLLVVFGRGSSLPDCTPHPVPVAGWKLPFSVVIGDSVVAWRPNEYAAKRHAVALAYENPAETIRVASITEMRWQLRDGSDCVSTYGTQKGEVAWSANR